MEQAEDFEKHRLIVESECWRLLYHISTWKGYVSPKILGYLVGVVNACMIKLILPSEVIEKTFNVSLDEFISKVNREVEKRKSNPLYNLDSVTRYIIVRELLDEWRERRKERLAKMNPHPSTIEQIGSGRGCRMEDVEGIIKKFNATLESMFEKYESTIEEMIKKYL